MIKHLWTLGLVVALGGAPATAADLNIWFEVGGLTDLTGGNAVAPGATVNWELWGQLTSTVDNDGLALWVCDLHLEGGTPFSVVDLPAGSNGPPVGMENFARHGADGTTITNLGLTNPAGYGGTKGVPGRLNDVVQAGGSMNTINNFALNAPFPVGTVDKFVAHTPQLLLTGSFTAPTNQGQYTLSALSCKANVLQLGHLNGDPFWATSAVPNVTITNLPIEVQTAVAAFVDSSIACEKSLPWSGNGVIRITFAAPVALPSPGEIEIRELLAGGSFGADLSSNFTYSLESGNTVLRIEENGSVLAHETWYAVMNNGAWSSAANFRRNYEKVIGDADNNRITDFSDLGIIFGNFSPPAPGDNARPNTDQNVAIDFSDLGIAFGNFTTPPAAPIPAGHESTCSP